MQRVHFTAPDLGEFDHRPGQELVLVIPVRDGEPARRHLTISSLDRDARWLTVDFVLHGHGAATEWARHAKPGDTLEAIGPRGRIVPVLDAEWHLFCGDETCIPAIFAIARALPRGARARAFIEIDGPDERQELDAECDLDLRWLYRNRAAAGPSDIVLRAVDEAELPNGRGHAYIIGETSNVRAVRQRLLTRGLDRTQISAEGFWRPGRIGGHDHVKD
jgi:NADPH-dependent ferric siderophore reductase